jgi:hypothetical protein
MENLTNWLVETKPTNKYLAWTLLNVLKDGDMINSIHRKWLYKTVIQYLRLPKENYSQRNHDWFEDCMKLIEAYRKSLNK